MLKRRMPAMVPSNIGAYVGGEEVTHSEAQAPHPLLKSYD
jgi:hypothetical protein